MLKRKGVTLVELMIALALVTIGIIAMVNSFGFIQKGIQASKNKTLASNLAQEKMQIIKQKVYYQVLVTSDPAHNTTDFDPETFDYDTGYFPPEYITEAGVTYARYTLVQVAKENSGQIQILSPSTPDTGLRLITIIVVWSQGGVKRKLSLRSLMANPDTVMSNAVFTGYVRDTGGLPIVDALVSVVEDAGWRDNADATGSYGINVSQGNFNIVVSAKGYYTQMRPAGIAANDTQTQDFNLVKIATGTITGRIWLRDHLVISQVVGSSANISAQEQEWVEVYNPTTWTWTMATGLGTGANEEVVISYKESDELEVKPDFYYRIVSLAPNSYFLFANTGTITAAGIVREADAVYDRDSDWASLDNVIQTGSPSSAGYVILGSEATGQILDKVGWNASDNSSSDKKNAESYEGQAIAQDIGLQVGEEYVRRTASGGITAGQGRCYDSNNNEKDFIDAAPLSRPPYNTADLEPCVSGTPAIGAVVTASDGLSSSTQAWASGSPPDAVFTLVDVATGTWTVLISSGQYMLQNDTIAVPTAGYVYNFPSSSTFLNQSAVMGIITGQVLDALGIPISAPSSIIVSPGGAGSPAYASTSDGRYRLLVSSGMLEVTANPGNANGNYVSISSLSITAEIGMVHSGVDFVLYQGGRINGFITRDGINALPGIAVSITDLNGISRDQQMSGTNGRFTSVSIPTGTYTVSPALGSLEQAVPSSTTVSLASAGVTKFSSTFTITGALGYITGSVSFGGQPIKTGVLIVVTTATLTGSPPVPPSLSSATLSGSPYYVVSSMEDGTYRVEARQATAPKYNVYAYYPSPSGVYATMISSASSNVQVLSGQTTTGVNFSW